MSTIVVVGEDALCCALGERMVQGCLPEWQLAFAPINKLGVTKLKVDLPRYTEQAAYVQTVLCIADTDGACPVDLRADWLPRSVPARLLLRFAVKEADSWVLADRAEFARHFGVPLTQVPRDVDALPDPKRALLTLAARSKKRLVREEVVSPFDASKPGTGYNEHLCHFVRTAWRIAAAAESSESLRRAAHALRGLAAPAAGARIHG
jgi:hypothetical protein